MFYMSKFHISDDTGNILLETITSLSFCQFLEIYCPCVALENGFRS